MKDDTQGLQFELMKNLAREVDDQNKVISKLRDHINKTLQFGVFRTVKDIDIESALHTTYATKALEDLKRNYFPDSEKKASLLMRTGATTWNNAVVAAGVKFAVTIYEPDGNQIIVTLYSSSVWSLIIDYINTCLVLEDIV